MLRRIEQEIPIEDLTFTQWVVLIQLRDGLAETGADLCRNLCHDSGATTRLIDQLEARGLVERTRSTEDRRVAKLSLTLAGRQMAKKIAPQVVDFWNDILSDFTHAEIDTFISLLERLLIRLEQDSSKLDSDKAKGEA